MAQAQTNTRQVAVILAAGQGIRMRSPKAKVLHPVLGRPMIAWVVEAALGAGVDRSAVVVGHQAEAVEAELKGRFSGTDLVFPRQLEQRGTGDAVRCALAAADGFDQVLILCGDTPAVDADLLERILAAHEASGHALTVASFQMDDPTGYGRIVRDGQGAVCAIEEEADCSDAQRTIDEVNAGIYVVEGTHLARALSALTTDNVQGELYLTDIVAWMSGHGHGVGAHLLPDANAAAGINTRGQLSALDNVLRRRLLHVLMEGGVTVLDPGTVRVEHGVTVGPDTILAPGVMLTGRTRVGAGCRIDQGCVLHDATLADGVHLKPYVVADSVSLGAQAVAGPFAHLRPGTVLQDGAKVGNFVEIKKTTLGPGSKANHLSYLGDAQIGAGVNVGAGTITCNYDGTHKHQTVIEDEVFIGSDTQLVAPVRLGRRATIAAGTTVTEDVPPGALALSRSPQVTKEGYDESHRRPREEAAKAGD